MSTYTDQAALVTGANSGLGFEAAAQLAELGYGSVTLACRTQEKADAAAQELRARPGLDGRGSPLRDNAGFSPDFALRRRSQSTTARDSSPGRSETRSHILTACRR